MPRSPIYFNVAPRYAGGSPAQVDEQTARRVAKDEQEAYERHVEGAYGPEGTEKATKLGLAGIVEMRIEKTRGWLVEDLLTGKRFYRQFVVTKTLTTKERGAAINWEFYGKR